MVSICCTQLYFKRIYILYFVLFYASKSFLFRRVVSSSRRKVTPTLYSCLSSPPAFLTTFQKWDTD